MKNLKEVVHDHYYEYPEWAKTSLGTVIPCFASYPLTQGSKSNCILLIGGVHGDEPEGVALTTETLEFLKKSSNNSQQDWVVVPCINPDGLTRNERTNANGVDLNRNFPTKDWTSEAKKPRYAPGPRPASENETKALVELIDAIQPKLIIHCHAWSGEPCVVYTGDKGRDAAKSLAESSGFALKETIGYDAPGSLGDYGGHDLGIPVICIECFSGEPMDGIWPKFERGMRDLFLGLVRRSTT